MPYTMKIIHTLKEFHALIQSNPKVVADFYADWCGPCKKIAPELEKLAKELPGIVFVKVNVEENEDATEEYVVSALPTFLFFHEGAVVRQFSGASIENLKKNLEYLASL